MASTLWFYLTKDQTSYFIVLMVLILVAIGWIAIFVPESPLFLYEKGEFTELEKSLQMVAKLNGI